MAWRRGFGLMGRAAKPMIDVEFPGAGLAGVRVSPGTGTGRPPEADRLDLALGLIAWGVHRTHEDEVRPAADRVRELATAVAASDDGRVPEGTVRVVTRTQGLVPVQLASWSGDRGLTRVRAEISHSAVGPVPLIKGSPSAGMLMLAGLCAVMDDAERSDADGRLALALALEGLIAWYAEAHRMTPARDAVRSARAHAADRLRSAGRDLPPSLWDAPG